MKRFLMLVAVATVAGAMYVAAAPGSQQAAGPTATQFAALKKQVASLTKKLKALKADETKVKKLAVDTGGFIVACFLSQNSGAQGVSQFGDPSGTYGFEYISTPGAPVTAATPRTGLDLDASTTPHDFLQTVDPMCVNTGASAASPMLSHSGLGLRVLRAEHTR